jgi:hypothetical protein
MTHAISNGVDICADNQLLFDQGSESVTRVGFCMETDYIDWTLLRHFKYTDPGSAFNLGLLKPVFRTAFLRKSGVRYNRNDRSGEDFVFYAELLIRGANADILSTPGYIYTFPVGELSSLPSAWRRSHVNLDMLIGVMTDLDDRYKGRLSASEHDALMRRLTKCRQLRTCKEIWNRLVNRQYGAAMRTLVQGSSLFMHSFVYFHVVKYFLFKRLRVARRPLLIQ